MQLSALLASLAVISSALALPQLLSEILSPECLTSDEVNDVVNTYQQLIANYSPSVAQQYIADNFIEYSDSINTLANIPLGSPTFPNKQAFMAAQASNPAIPLEVQDIKAVQCDTIALTWTATFGEANESVRGITTIVTTKQDGCWQIQRIDVEFNSLIWLVNIGGTFAFPS